LFRYHIILPHFFKIRSVLPTLKTQARAKVRASDVRLTFVWSSLVLRSVS
jgi:hypothetical protein